MENHVYLVLENGTIFQGKQFGASGDVTGELVFSTAMTGCLELITDKSHYGQVVLQTFPLIGNYGVIPADFESEKPQIKGYIVKEWCEHPSNFRCEGDIHTFLKENNVVGIYGIDTRALTKIIRENGVMNCTITAHPKQVDLKALKQYSSPYPVPAVSIEQVEKTESKHGKFHVVLYDFGVKENIKRELLTRDCHITQVPYHTSAKEILAMQPDGILLSNGPGSPMDNLSIVEEIRQLMQSRIPMFGICMGHQLLAMAAGGTIEKMKSGHRGGNQPVLHPGSGRIYITSQNHGYIVADGSLPDAIAKTLFLNANDQTCEGLEYLEFPGFSVQVHPEAAAGPQDTRFLFDQFIMKMEEHQNAAE